MNKKQRIMFAGPSGSGKTTLANWVAEIGNDTFWPFLSGSVSDLLPQTKNESHKDMLSHDKSELYKQDFQILSLRSKRYANQETFVTDRSYLDSAAYFLYKQSDTLPQCEVEHFLELCKKCLCQQCDQLFFIDFTTYMVRNWVMEDNNKRILNRYFQAHIASIMRFILSDWGVKFKHYNHINCFSKSLKYGGYENGALNTHDGSVNITIINEPGLDIRKRIISNVLNK